MKNSSSNLSSNNFGEIARDWLIQEGFSIEQLNESGFVSLFRAYRSENPENKLSIGQQSKDDKLIIAARLLLDEQIRSNLLNLQSYDKNRIQRDILELLHNRSTLFNANNQDGVLKELTISGSIYSDGLTKDRLMTVISEINKTQALVLLKLSEYLSNLDSSKVTQSQQKQQKSQRVSSTCPDCKAEYLPNQRFCGKCGKELS